jgi:hypothetical protein
MDNAGSILTAFAAMPKGFYPMIERGDVVIVRMQDENQVPTVMALRLIPPASAK